MEEYKKMGDVKGATMTPDEVMQKLLTHDMQDEIDVANKYLDYAVVFDNQGKSCIAKRLAEMGYEEYTHAHVQREILVEHGYMPSQETAVAFEQLKNRIYTLFRK